MNKVPGGMNQPALPPGTACTVPGDLNILTEGAGADAQHRHTLIGGVCIPHPADGHWHYRKADGELLTVGPTDHPAPTAHNHGDALAQDYFLCFVRCQDDELASLMADPWKVVPLAFAKPIGDDSFGELDDTDWDDASDAYLRKTAQDNFGFTIPSEITNGAELVPWILGSLLSRKVVDDKPYR